jgi:penicillin-binding protein 1A
VPSLALGSGEVTLQELTSAYGAFASAGVYHHPVLIRRIEDSDGTVLFEADETGVRAVSEQTAFLLTSMLSDVVNAGTAWKARQGGFTLPAAGKTGTTNDYVDAWFEGYTPHLVTGVWLGFDQPKTILPGGYAGELAVPLWAKFMKVATAGDHPDNFPVPKGLVAVEVCRISGRLPAAGCSDVEVVNDAGETTHRSMVYTDYFPRGQAPTETCPIHAGSSLMNKVAGFFGQGHPASAPVAASQLGLPQRDPPGRVSDAVPDGDPAHPAAEQKTAKKRGFWSRVFGAHDKDKDKPASNPPKPQ